MTISRLIKESVQSPAKRRKVASYASNVEADISTSVEAGIPTPVKNSEYPKDQVLHGGLGVVQPPTWQLTEDPKKLHYLLTEVGFVAVVGVLSPEQADSFKEGICDVFTQCNKHWETNPVAAPSPGTRGHGLQKYYGIALCEACQKIRMEPKIRLVFEALYQERDLVCSLDAPGVMTRHILLDRQNKNKCSGVFAGSTLKPHVDMTKNGPSRLFVDYVTRNPDSFHLPVQGCMVCQDQIPMECEGKFMAPPGFVAMPGKQPPLQSGAKEFRLLSDEELDEHDVLARCRYVSAEKGTLLLWRSDVVHNSYGGDPELFKHAKGSFCRLVQFVSFGPRGACDANARERKISLWDNEKERKERENSDMEHVKKKKKKFPPRYASTSHYSHVCVTSGPGHMSNTRNEDDPKHWNIAESRLLDGQRALL